MLTKTRIWTHCYVFQVETWLFISVHEVQNNLFGFICQSVISWLMLIPDSTTFEVLLNYFTFFGWLGYGASISSVLWLRYKRPNAVRPYKVKISRKINSIAFTSLGHALWSIRDLGSISRRWSGKEPALLSWRDADQTRESVGNRAYLRFYFTFSTNQK